MSNNYQDSSVVVPVFTGINDVPQVPTASQAGNGSDIIARLNNLLSFLDTDIPDLDSRVSTLEGYINFTPNPTSNFILDVSNRTDFSEWFGGNYTDAWLFVFFLPETKNYFYYDDSTQEHKPISLENFDYNFNSNAQSLSTLNKAVLQISEADLAVNSFDLTDWITKQGQGLYIFMIYNFVSAGSYGSPDNYELPNNVNGVKLQAIGNLEGARIVNLEKDFVDNNASNSPFNAGSDNFGLLVENDIFTGTIEIVQL